MNQQVVYQDISRIHPYENNPRNNEAAIEPVAQSIKEFGFRVPILIDGKGTIIAGHTRYEAAKSLAECYKVMKPGAKMFLSCPNTPGNGYQTQYRAHVYEWGYDELKSKLAEIGFSIVQEVGLVTSVREMDEFYSKQEPALRDFYTRMKAYVPSAFLTTFMAIPFPREAKELLFIVQKPKGEENNG